MPTITVSYHDLCTLAQWPLTTPLGTLDRQLALVKGELSRRAASGEALQDDRGAWLAQVDTVDLRIELADTNRPDLWSVEGIARQLRDHSRGHSRTYHFASTGATPLPLHIDVDPQLRSIRPYIGGFLARGQTLTETGLLAFIESQETLTRNFGRKRKTLSIGIYRGDTLAFPIHYQAVDPNGVRFVPLAPAVQTTPPWTDGKALTPAEILRLHPTGQEYASLVAGFDRVPFLVDTGGAVLSFPPIINSNDLGRVQPGASSLFVEATGEDLEQVLLTLNILATNFADRGWEIVPVTIHYPFDTPRGRALTTPHPLAYDLPVPVAEFSRILGEETPPHDIVEKLAAYGVTAAATGDIVTATCPPYRQDYLHPVDVIEDYAISRGYDQIAPFLPSAFTVGKLDPLTEYEDELRDRMIGFGFEEAFCNILTGIDAIRSRMDTTTDAEATTPAFHGGPAVAIANVMNRNYSHLRDWLLPSLLDVESHSAGALYPHRLFEVGEIARHAPHAELGARTESRLAGLVADDTANFDSAQSILYALFAALGVAFTIQPWRHPSFIPGRVALVTAAVDDGGKVPAALGFLGELSPQVLSNWSARTPAAAFELSVDALFALASPTIL